MNLLTLSWSAQPSPAQPTDLLQSVHELLGGELDERCYELAHDIHSHHQAPLPLGPDDGVAHQLLLDHLQVRKASTVRTSLAQKTIPHNQQTEAQPPAADTREEHVSLNRALQVSLSVSHLNVWWVTYVLDGACAHFGLLSRTQINLHSVQRILVWKVYYAWTVRDWTCQPVWAGQIKSYGLHPN